MEKGKLGIRVAFYGVAAFVLAYLGSTTLLFLMAGVVLLAEKNEWAFRQVIQAIGLCLVGSLVRNVLGIFDFLYSIPYISSVWNVIIDIIYKAIEIVVLALAVVGVLKNMKGDDASLPLLSKMADWACGVVAKQATPAKEAAPQEAQQEAPQAE